MKTYCLLTVVFVFSFAVSTQAAVQDVVWNGGTGSWMTQSNWTENTTDGSKWAIPGWVSDNPYNPGTWTSTSNSGFAIISTGTAQVTPTSRPDARVERCYVGYGPGSVGNMQISGDYLGYKLYTASDVTSTGNITQTAGIVTIEDYAYLGLGGQGTYNLQGGTLNVKTRLALGWTASTSNSYLLNQTGGTIKAKDFRLGNYDNARGTYVISGGSLLVDDYIASYFDATFKVSGSDATSIQTLQIAMSRAAGTNNVLAFDLDEGGSTLIEVTGNVATGSAREGCYLGNVTLRIDTIDGFDGRIGDVYNLIWSATTFDVAGLVFDNLSSTQFNYAVIPDTVRGGQVLKLTIVPEPMTLALLGIGSLFMAGRKRKE